MSGLESGSGNRRRTPFDVRSVGEESYHLAPAARPAELDAELPPSPRDVFDLAAALKCAGGDMARLQKGVELYFREAPRLPAEMRAAAAVGDAVTIARAAHRLAGTLVYLGAPAALAAARRVDECGIAGDLTAAAEAIAALERELARLDSALAPHRLRAGVPVRR